MRHQPFTQQIIRISLIHIKAGLGRLCDGDVRGTTYVHLQHASGCGAGLLAINPDPVGGIPSAIVCNRFPRQHRRHVMRFCILADDLTGANATASLLKREG
jgi:hypothetical protein